VDEVAYDVGVDPWKQIDTAGYSIQLDTTKYSASENDDGANWCASSQQLSLGDYATPGTDNDACV